MKLRCGFGTLLLWLVLLASTAGAEQTVVQASVDAYTRAQFPQLTEADWLRYEVLLRGPAGYTTAKELDPVTVLGIYARDDAERVRWAEVAAQQEHERIAAELAYAAAYSAAWRRLYPDERFGADPLPAPVVRQEPPQADRPLSARLMLFVDAAAPVKSNFLADPLARTQALAGTAPSIGLDVYVVGAKDTAAAQAWADRQRVGRPSVPVTMQPDDGTLAQASAMAGVPVPRLPALIRRERTLTEERFVPMPWGTR